MAEIMLKARNINESLKHEHRKISNHHSSCQDLSYKYEADQEARQYNSQPKTNETGTFQKLIKEMGKEENRAAQTARLVLKQDDDSPKEVLHLCNSEKKHARGNSQTHQKDWSKVRVDIQLNNYKTGEVSALVSPSKTAAVSHQISKLNSPRTKLGKDTKGKFKFPEAQSKKQVSRNTKKSSSKLPSKVLKLQEKKESVNKVTKAKKGVKQKSKHEYTYGEEKKNFPFNPIYTPSVKIKTEFPKQKHSDQDIALSSDRRPLFHKDYPRQSISPSKKLIPKQEPSVPELPKTDSVYKLDELRGLPSSRRSKNSSEFREQMVLKSEYVSPGMQRVCERELESYKIRMSGGGLRQSEEEQRIYRKVKRMQEVARQLYNS